MYVCSQISKLVDNMKRLESTIDSLRESTAAQVSWLASTLSPSRSLSSALSSLLFQISQLEDVLHQKNKIIAHLTEKLDQRTGFDRISFANNNECGANERVERDSSTGKACMDALIPENKKLDSLKVDLSQDSQQLALHRQLLNTYVLPQLPALGNVESFGTLLGEEIANKYAKALIKRDPSILSASASVNKGNNTPGKCQSNMS